MTNPIPFIYGLAAIYLIYYLANLLFDLLTLPGTDPKGGDLALTVSLSDLEEPIDASSYLDDDQGLSQSSALLSSGEVSASGGVRFEEVLSLALNDSIFYTRQIPV